VGDEVVRVGDVGTVSTSLGSSAPASGPPPPSSTFIVHSESAVGNDSSPIEWQKYQGQPCFLEEAPFRRWLNRKFTSADASGVPSAPVGTRTFERTYWDYMMVLAWVYFRDRALIEKVADSAVNRRTFYQQERLPDGRTEMVETDAGPITPLWLTLLGNQRRENPGAAAAIAPLMTCAEAQATILEKLVANLLTAYGLDNDAGDLQAIPALWWAAGKIYEGNNGRTYAGPVDVFRTGATRWHGLLFERKQVLSLWPEGSADVANVPAESVAVGTTAASNGEEPPALPQSEVEMVDDPAPRGVGRPVEYDWASLQAEIVRVADLDGLPAKQSELVERLLQWCENEWGRQPAESAIKARVSEIYNRLGRGQKFRTQAR
jgi:hypothetical protein